MNELAYSNDYLALLAEVQKMQEKLSTKIIERDNLLLIECKNLNARYYTSIGVYEYKVFEQYCNIKRIKRKIELIQMHLNRCEAFLMDAVEEQLDWEYSQYTQKLDEY